MTIIRLQNACNDTCPRQILNDIFEICQIPFNITFLKSGVNISREIVTVKSAKYNLLIPAFVMQTDFQ